MSYSRRTSEEKIDVIILVGGMGYRLRSVVSDVPKPLAPINGVSFLDVVLARLNRYGFIRKVVLAVGYKAEMVMERYAPPHGYSFEIDFSVEKELLGTGGAIKLASKMTTSETVLALNGDTFVAVDLRRLLLAHKRKKAMITAAVRMSDSSERYGHIAVDENSMIASFAEKTVKARETKALINAGLYAMRRAAFDFIAEGKSSLEVDVLPRLISKFPVYGHLTNGKFIDIGIPETYLAACDYLTGILRHVHGRSQR